MLAVSNHLQTHQLGHPGYPVFVHRADWGVCDDGHPEGTGHWIPRSATVQDLYDAIIEDYVQFGYTWVFSWHLVSHGLAGDLPNPWLRPHGYAFRLLAPSQLKAEDVLKVGIEKITIGMGGSPLFIAVPDVAPNRTRGGYRVVL